MKSKRICLLILILTLIVATFPTISNAELVQQKSEGGGAVEILNPDDYNPGEVTQSDVGEMAEMTGTILAYIRNIGIFASVIVLTVIGIKYMLGSLEQKADYKEDIYVYIIGCFLLMMATTIPSIVYSIMN